MKTNVLISAALLSIAVFSTVSAETIQHKLVRVVLDAENASYVVMEQAERVTVVTYGYKNAGETCKFLQDKGINAIFVENYTSGKDGMITITSKSC